MKATSAHTTDIFSTLDKIVPGFLIGAVAGAGMASAFGDQYILAGLVLVGIFNALLSAGYISKIFRK